MRAPGGALASWPLRSGERCWRRTRTCRRSVRRLADAVASVGAMLRCRWQPRLHRRLCCTAVGSMVVFEIPFCLFVDV